MTALCTSVRVVMALPSNLLKPVPVLLLVFEFDPGRVMETSPMKGRLQARDNVINAIVRKIKGRYLLRDIGTSLEFGL
jgi:hypothetical protein